MERRLAAILVADVVGYSRLMEADEEATARTLNVCRKIVDGLVADHRGRVFGSAGDSVVAEFPSPVEAVRCAVDIQRELEAHNVDLPEDQRMRLRIGVNLGDVIVEGDNLLGDGVNIAARLETLADAGGICLSRPVFDQVKKQLDLGYEHLGEHEVKNIAEPIRVYRVLTEPEAAGKVIGETKRATQAWKRVTLAAAVVVLIGVASAVTWLRPWEPTVEPASVERMAFPLPDKPSIAVLPFDNLSADPEHERHSDGTTDNLITMLSKVPELFVIARNSTFTYKGKPVRVQEVAEELGVRYVLEGSFQRQSDQVRINLQLVDALTGHHLWAERYDRTIDDIFALQDDIALNVVSALRVLLREGKKGEIARPPTRSLEAWNLSLLAESYSEQWTGEGKAKARELWTKALEIDPKFVFAWNMIGWTHWADVRFGWSSSPEDSLRQALEAAQHALSIDPSDADVYSLLEGISLIEGEHDKALAYGEKSISLNPNSADNVASHAIVEYFSGQPEAAERSVKRAMRLNPAYPLWYFLPLSEAYRLAGHYDDAIETTKEELRRLDHFFTRTRLALCYAQSGRDAEARAEIERVLQAKPDMNLQYWANAQYFKEPARLERDLAALRKAGLPE